jgi:restriction system protein
MRELKGKLRPLLEKLISNVFKILVKHDGQMKGTELMEAVCKASDLDEWALERFERTGEVRWQSVLNLRSIAAVKAGFLVRKKGVWYLTKEGFEAAKLGPKELFVACQKGYARWKASQATGGDSEVDALESGGGVDDAAVIARFAELESDALASIEDFIRRKTPYEFQDMCAALFRAMGYYTPFVAPKGPDGGVDVIAYRDPMGAVSPRLRVQVKHRSTSAPADDVRKLIGVLGGEDRVGIIVSSGGFTSDARREALRSHVHVELIDLPRFIDLWQEFYLKLTDEDKQLMPLQPIYFLAPQT